jgi:hypothetical protein
VSPADLVRALGGAASRDVPGDARVKNESDSPAASISPRYSKEGATLTDADIALLCASAIDPAVACERGYRTITIKAQIRDKGFSASHICAMLSYRILQR